MEHLKTLLHSLPQELYDQIYRDVFTAVASRVHIRQSYRPPQLLFVSSDTRKQFAESYYGDTLFVVDNDLDLHKWLHGVAGAGYLELLNEVRFMNRSLLDPCVSRLQAPCEYDSTRMASAIDGVRFFGAILILPPSPLVDRSHLYRRTAAEQHARHLLARLKRNLDESKLAISSGVLTLEQHFLDDDMAEDVVVCRLSDNVSL